MARTVKLSTPSCQPQNPHSGYPSVIPDKKEDSQIQLTPLFLEAALGLNPGPADCALGERV